MATMKLLDYSRRFGKSARRLLLFVVVLLCCGGCVLSLSMQLPAGLSELLAVVLAATVYFLTGAKREAVLLAGLILLIVGASLTPFFGTGTDLILTSAILVLGTTLLPDLKLPGRQLVRAHMRFRMPERIHARATALPSWVPRLALAAFAVVMLFALLPSATVDQGHRLVGSHLGQPIWNVHFLSMQAEKRGLLLIDRSVLNADGQPARIGAMDVPLFDLIKELAPSSMDGGRIWNMGIVAGQWALALVLVVFFYVRTRSWPSAMLASFLYLLIPFASEIREASPFDLVFPMAATIAALTPRLEKLVIPLAIASPFVNVAGGAECAVLLVAASFAVGKNKKTLFVGALSALGLGAVLQAVMASIAPDITTLIAWWRSQDLFQTFIATRSQSAVLPTILLALLGVVGATLAYRSRARETFGLILAFCLAACVFGLPSSVGDLAYYTPARLLDGFNPLWWPSGRVLQIFALGLALGAAYLASLAESRISLLWNRRLLAVLALAVIVFLVSNSMPALAPLGIADVRTRGRVIQFPIAQPLSVAGVSYATDLFENRLPTAQPLAFIKGTRIDYSLDPLDRRTPILLLGLGVRTVVVRTDIYLEPMVRYVVAPLHGDLNSSVPDLGNDSQYQFFQALEGGNAAYLLK